MNPAFSPRTMAAASRALRRAVVALAPPSGGGFRLLGGPARRATPAPISRTTERFLGSRRRVPPPLRLTASCAAAMRSLVDSKDGAIGMRIIMTEDWGSASGVGFRLEFAYEHRKGDEIVHGEGRLASCEPPSSCRPFADGVCRAPRLQAVRRSKGALQLIGPSAGLHPGPWPRSSAESRREG